MDIDPAIDGDSAIDATALIITADHLLHQQAQRNNEQITPELEANKAQQFRAALENLKAKREAEADIGEDRVEWDRSTHTWIEKSGWSESSLQIGTTVHSPTLGHHAVEIAYDIPVEDDTETGETYHQIVILDNLVGPYSEHSATPPEEYYDLKFPDPFLPTEEGPLRMYAMPSGQPPFNSTIQYNITGNTIKKTVSLPIDHPDGVMYPVVINDDSAEVVHHVVKELLDAYIKAKK